jgi:hypothetical protein
MPETLLLSMPCCVTRGLQRTRQQQRRRFTPGIDSL